jgi:enoyl-CoA hydratase/carnithine racemase
VSAAEALASGLVNRIAATAEGLIEDVLAYIEPIIAGAPIALRAALAAVDASFDVGLAEGLAREADEYEACLLSEDRKSALRAFAQKQKPVFRGR